MKQFLPPVFCLIGAMLECSSAFCRPPGFVADFSAIYQDTFPGGVIFLPAAIYDGLSDADLPASRGLQRVGKPVDWRTKCNPADHQDKYGICFPIACINAIELMEVLETLPMRQHFPSYAPMFNFQMAHGDCKKGINAVQLFKSIEQDGICTTDEYPCMECPRCPDPTQAIQDIAKKRAGKYKFQAIWKASTEASRRRNQTIRYLQWRYPVVVCFSGKSRKNASSKVDHQILNGHAMLVVGYRSVGDSHTEGEFILQNSLGPYSDDHGFLRMSYADFEQYAQEGYALGLLAQNKGEDNCEIYTYSGFSGSMTLFSKHERERDYAQSHIRFDQENSQYNTPTTWQAKGWNDFQLQFTIPLGACAYLLRFQNTGTVELLDQTEWALTDSIPLAPPLRSHAFQLEKGTTTFVLLQTMYPIENFAESLEKLNNPNGTIRARLERAFDPCTLLSAQDSGYASEEMKFVPAVRNGKGMAVPLILELVGY